MVFGEADGRVGAEGERGTYEAFLTDLRGRKEQLKEKMKDALEEGKSRHWRTGYWDG